MPDTACLHIRAGDTDPIRVVEIAGISVRIGRASYCEVRIPEPELAEEECRLRKRGGAWQLVPTRAANSVTIEGRQVDSTCPLPFGVPFRIGDHWLTLRPTSTAQPDWGLYATPVRPESAPVSPAMKEHFRPVPRAEVARPTVDIKPPTPPPPAPSPGADHLAEWRNRQEQRASRTRANDDQRSWEERWKAAGERIRTRRATTSPHLATPHEARYQQPQPYDLGGETPRFDAPTPLETKYEQPQPYDLGGETPRFDAPTPPSIPAIERPRSRPERVESRPSPFEAPETKRVSPIPPSASELSGNSWNSPQTSERTEPDLGEYAPPRPEQFATHLGPAVTISPVASELTEWAAPPSSTATMALDTPVEPHHEGTTLPADQYEPVASPSASAPAPAPAQDSSEGSELPQTSRILRLLSPIDATTYSTLPNSPAASANDVADVEPRGFLEPSDLMGRRKKSPAEGSHVKPEREPVQQDPTVTAPRPTTARDHVEAKRNGHHSAPVGKTNETSTQGNPQRRSPATHNPDARNGRTRPTSPPSEREPSPKPTSQPLGRPTETPGISSLRESGPTESPRDWPRASDIFAAHQVPVPTATPLQITRRNVGAEQLVTEWHEPASWSLPLWAGWLPACLLVFPIGIVVLTVSWAWTLNDQATGLVSGLLARNDLAKPVAQELIPRNTPWWKTSAGNLAFWATYFERRTQTATEEIAEARAFLDAAAKASPIHAQTLLARARLNSTNESDTQYVASFGLSRDIEALAFSGQRCLKAGKKEAALKLYRQALDITSRVRITRMTLPAFDDESQVRRYRLPNEELIHRIISDMASDGGWTYAEWSAAVPSSPLIQLVTARVLTERGAPEVQKVIDQILEPTQAGASSLPTTALDAAAQAEAFALKSQWEEAQERYRVAVGLMPNDLIRRSWWLNLADLALRLNDEVSRQKALEQAKGDQSADEVAKRATELLKYSSVKADRNSQPRR